jgi:hypothetical protein
MMSLLRLRRSIVLIATLTAQGCGSNQLTIPTDGQDGGDETGSAGTGATRIERVEGDSQIAATEAEVAVRPAVRVTDDLGQPVAGYAVTFVVTGGEGTLLDPSRTTGSDGIARVGGWTLGAIGLNTLEARAGPLSGSPVVFRATALSTASVDRFVFLVQPRGARVNEPIPVEVAMVDAASNVVPLSGIEIYLGLFLEGQEQNVNSRLLGVRFADTEEGVASFSLRVSKVGRYRLRALSDDLPAVGPHGPEPYLFSRPFNVY